VPKLTNRKLKNARKRLDKAHCKTGKIHRKRSHKIHAGRVITTSPKVGTKLPADAAIAVTVSRGGGGRAHR
jgi:beta-lactam-binding protein with PASTA domain